MKKTNILFASIAFFCLTNHIHAQSAELPKDPDTKKYTFKETVEVAGVNKDTLYNRAEKFLKYFYKSAILSVAEKENSELRHTGKYSFTWKPGGQVMTNIKEEWTVTYTITIRVKDGKYQYQITDFQGDYAGLVKQSLENCYNSYKKSREAIVTETNKEVEQVKQGLKQTMQDGSLPKDNANDF